MTEANCVTLLVTCYNTVCVYIHEVVAQFLLFFYCEALTSY